MERSDWPMIGGWLTRGKLDDSLILNITSSGQHITTILTSGEYGDTISSVTLLNHEA